MKFVSIDVGTKNLSFCLFNKNEDDTHFEILKWDNIDLTQKYDTVCIEQEKGDICGKPAKFIKDSKCYCLKHSKKMHYLLPNNDFHLPFLNKQSLTKLINIADKHKIPYEKPCKKSDILNIIVEFSNKNCFESVSKINATKIDLVTIGKNIQHKFDLLFQDHLDIDFISSSNKLKEFIKKNEQNEKLDYKQRKQFGIKTCLEIVASDFKYNVWSSFLQKHKKKDDLSDCFLQGLWYIKNKI